MRKPREPSHTAKTASVPPPGRVSVSLAEAAALTGLSVSSLRRAEKAGALLVRHFGARVIVRRVDLDVFLNGLPQGFQSKPKAAAAE